MFVDMPTVYWDQYRPILRQWYTDAVLDGCAAWLAEDFGIQAEIFEERQQVFLDDYIYILELYIRDCASKIASSLYKPVLVAP